MGGSTLRESALYCVGCGVPLQAADPKQPGYVPEKVLAEAEQDAVCQRCFRIRHYNEVAPVVHDPGYYEDLLRRIADTDSLVVQVVDLFDFDGSWIPDLPRWIGENPLLLIANKIDLFPKSVKHGRIREWVRRSAERLGANPVDIVLCSAAKGFYIREVMAAIERHRQGRDVYVVGVTNVGKSTLINRLLHDFGDGGQPITTSPYPGTTLDTIRIPLEDGRSLIDTPGIVRKDRLSEWVSPADLKVIVPKGTINPRVYQLNDRQTLFLGGLARVDFIKGPRQPFVLYVSNALYVHRTKYEKADEIQRTHLGELLAPPEDPSVLPPWRKQRFHIPGGGKQDLVIAGLGWIAVGKEAAEIEVWAPEGIQVELRPSVI
jgi:ribosome biogenesis GTPase YqeH